MSPEAELFTLHCVGKQASGDHAGWFLFQAPTNSRKGRTGWDSYVFVSEVKEWLLDIGHQNYHAGNGDIEGVYATMPQAHEKGKSFCVKLRRLGDVTRFSKEFRVDDLDKLHKAYA